MGGRKGKGRWGLEEEREHAMKGRKEGRRVALNISGYMIPGSSLITF